MKKVDMCINFFMFTLCILFLKSDHSFAKSTKYVTYHSVSKLVNVDYNVRLHSHDIKYGTGSGQQSVTAIEAKEDGNSYWLIKGPTNKNYTRGKLIKCGDTIRFEHTTTKKNLHSHHVSSPLSGKQEVSAYGNDGEGDTGDHWIIVCPGTYWERHETIMLKHIDTEAYLAVTGRTYGTPIIGQNEVVGEYTANSFSKWQVMEGLFIHPKELEIQQYKHSEL